MNSRQHIRELLPFHANGTLSDEEREQVEAALANDPALKQEAELLQLLRDKIRKLPQPKSPGEFGLARLRRDISNEESPADVHRTAGTDTRRGWWATWQPRIAVAAMLLVIVQGGALVYQQQALEESRLVPMGASGYAGPVIQVTFRPGVTAMAIEESLTATETEIIAGPSAAGVYRLRLRDSAASAEKAQETVQRLARMESVFAHVALE